MIKFPTPRSFGEFYWEAEMIEFRNKVLNNNVVVEGTIQEWNR